LAWRIELTATAAKQIGKFDKAEAKRLMAFLRGRLAVLDDPRRLGKRLTGPELGSYWRYRVGDYRLICDIQDDILRILVIEVGHRREVYR
jgi:mRNA interferase RelE/StbE